MRRRTLATAVTALLVLAACSSEAAPAPTVVDATTTLVPVSTDASTTSVTTAVTEATPTPTTQPERPYSLWQEIDRPVLPEASTTPFVDNGTLLDGTYWVELNANTPTAPDVTVEQAFFGAECERIAAELGDECLNDVYVLSPPNRIVDDLPFAPDAVISVSNPNTRDSFGITPEELMQVQIGPPSAGAPDDYLFVPFGWLMTVVDGQITRLEQVWTP